MEDSDVMSWKSQTDKNNKKGFTFVEVILTIVIAGILAVASLSYIGDSIDWSQYDQTRKEMEAIRDSLIGNKKLKVDGSQNNFGYLGDMGALPTVSQGLSALVTNPTSNTWQMSSTTKVGAGWRGPYIQSAEGITDVLKDEWGNDYLYQLSGGVYTLKSLGADGAIGGTKVNEDIILEILASEQFASVSGSLINAGKQHSGGAVIELYSPNGLGVISTKTVTLSGDETNTGHFTFNSVPYGTSSAKIFVPNKTDTKRREMGPILVNINKPVYNLDSKTFSFSYDVDGECKANIVRKIPGSILILDGSTNGTANLLFWVKENVTLTHVKAKIDSVTRKISAVAYTPSDGQHAYWTPCSGNYNPPYRLYSSTCPANQEEKLVMSPAMTFPSEERIVDFRINFNWTPLANTVSELELTFYYADDKGCDKLVYYK